MRDNDGYIEVKDRANDIIVLSSGDSAITVDVESVLFSHPAILEAAVVGGPDGWCYGEISPCAFVKDIIKHCRDLCPHTRLHKPWSSTGKAYVKTFSYFFSIFLNAAT